MKYLITPPYDHRKGIIIISGRNVQTGRLGLHRELNHKRPFMHHLRRTLQDFRRTPKRSRPPRWNILEEGKFFHLRANAQKVQRGCSTWKGIHPRRNALRSRCYLVSEQQTRRILVNSSISWPEERLSLFQTASSDDSENTAGYRPHR